MFDLIDKIQIKKVKDQNQLENENKIKIKKEQEILQNIQKQQEQEQLKQKQEQEKLENLRKQLNIQKNKKLKQIRLDIKDFEIQIQKNQKEKIDNLQQQQQKEETYSKEISKITQQLEKQDKQIKNTQNINNLNQQLQKQLNDFKLEKQQIYAQNQQIIENLQEQQEQEKLYLQEQINLQKLDFRAKKQAYISEQQGKIQQMETDIQNLQKQVESLNQQLDIQFDDFTIQKQQLQEQNQENTENLQKQLEKEKLYYQEQLNQQKQNFEAQKQVYLQEQQVNSQKMETNLLNLQKQIQSQNDNFEQNLNKELEKEKKILQKQLDSQKLEHKQQIYEIKIQEQTVLHQQKIEIINLNDQIKILKSDLQKKEVAISKQQNQQQLQYILDQNIQKLNSRKREILNNWNISKNHYEINYGPIEEFKNTYIIGDNIAKGGFGKVNELYVKDQEKHVQIMKKIQNFQNNQLVVKILDCQETSIDIQEKEVQIFQQINFLPQNLRQYIITTLDTYYDQKEQCIYIIQPRAKSSLKKEIEKRQLSQEFYKQPDIIFQLGCTLLGLTAMDIVGIAHRDIKTDNLLVMNDNSVTIADLGVAKKLQHKVEEHSTSGKGTPQYWAPEMFQYFFELENDHITEKDYSKSDLYAVGQCFLEASLLQKCVQVKNLNYLNEKTINFYIQQRQEQHKSIFTILRNEDQEKVNIAIQKLGLEDQKNKIPKYSKPFIDLLEKMLVKQPEKRITLQQCLEDLFKIKDW